MQIGDIGEFGLIQRIERAVRRGRKGRFVVRGIGDDAAVLRPRAGTDLVVSTDAVVEDVHFRFRSESARAIGRRALAAALSDLAAMGATPIGVMAALAAPPTLALARADGLVQGLVEGGRRWAAPLVGGNVTSAAVTSLTLSVFGTVARGRALSRAAARPDDRLYVTGHFGGVALAVARGERGGRVRAAPEPRLAAGRALARLSRIGACIDVSDGLLADLGHLVRASGVDAELDPERVPRAPGLARRAGRLGLDADRLALAGGEDYELLFSVRPGGPGSERLTARLGLPVCEIGRVTRPGRGNLAALEEVFGRRAGRRRGGAAPGGPGWTHF